MAWPSSSRATTVSPSLACSRRLVNDVVVAIEDVVVDHGVALDAEDVGAVAGVEEGFKFEGFAGFDGFDGVPGGDGADDGEGGGLGFRQAASPLERLPKSEPCSGHGG